MTGRLSAIWRHPIKSIGAEALTRTELATDQVLPGDRAYALAHVAAKLDTGARWFRKMNFVRGVAGPELMAITATTEGARITLSHPSAGTLTIDPDSPAGAADLIAWITPLWPDTRPEAARLIQTGHAMTDNEDAWVSVLNLASLADLSARMDRPLDMRRFRGNLWVDGAAPWAEAGWVGHTIRIGQAELEVVEPIARCEATSVDPATGRVQGHVLSALESAFGHRNFGVFARVRKGGSVALGDGVTW